MKDFFRDSSKLCIAWNIILASDSYWMLEILVTSCSGLVMQAKGGGGCTRSTIWVDYASENRVPQSECPMYCPHNSKDNKNTMQDYLVTAMTHVITLEAGPSSQGALKPITPVQLITNIVIYFQKYTYCHFIIWGVLFVIADLGVPQYFHACSLTATYFKLATSLFMFQKVYWTHLYRSLSLFISCPRDSILFPKRPD